MKFEGIRFHILPTKLRNILASSTNDPEVDEINRKMEASITAAETETIMNTHNFNLTAASVTTTTAAVPTRSTKLSSSSNHLTLLHLGGRQVKNGWSVFVMKIIL